MTLDTTQAKNRRRFVFEKYRGSILDGVRAALDDPNNFDRHNRLHLRSQYIRELA